MLGDLAPGGADAQLVRAARRLIHVFSVTLPAPLPPDEKEAESRCFWQAEEIRYETQAELLRLLQLLARHYSTAVLSMHPTVLSDATRVLTFAAIAAVADAVARRVACDVPSWWCLHYAGKSAGPRTLRLRRRRARRRVGGDALPRRHARRAAHAGARLL